MISYPLSAGLAYESDLCALCFGTEDLKEGMRAFLEKTVYNAPLGLLVTLEDDVRVPDPRIIPISLSTLLWTK